jgi:hypothetical protein
MTSVEEEQFRSRAYALGVDLFWHKPATEQEVQMFMECIESLLGRDSESAGFRGVQSKSLVDIIQLECLSNSSSVLRITNGQLSARIWIQDGELVDAETDELTGEEAFRKILTWRAGAFELLPADPSRPRGIFKSHNALLLESAHAFDEAHSQEGQAQVATQDDAFMSNLGQLEGIEFVLALAPGDDHAKLARGLENPKSMTLWARQNLERFRALGDRLQAGPLEAVGGLGPQRNVALAAQGDTEFCVGWEASMTAEEMDQKMRKVLSIWAS